MLEIYDLKIKEKKREIEKLEKLNGKDLFNEFTLNEKINNIKLRNKGLSSLSTNIDID